MRKPDLETFYDDETDTYDFEEYAVAVDRYEEECRDTEWDIGDQIHEQRRDEKDD